MMRKGYFYDGTKVNKEKLLEMLRNYDGSGDTSYEFDVACGFLGHGGYHGHDEDVELILEHLKDIHDVNLLDIDDILKRGGYQDGWYFCEIDDYKKQLEVQ